jgi:hypothetical protein
MYPVWQKEQQRKYIDTFHTDWEIFSIESLSGTGLDSPYKLSKIDIDDVIPWLYRWVELNSQHVALKLSKHH